LQGTGYEQIEDEKEQRHQLLCGQRSIPKDLHVPGFSENQSGSLLLARVESSLQVNTLEWVFEPYTVAAADISFLQSLILLWQTIHPLIPFGPSEYIVGCNSRSLTRPILFVWLPLCRTDS